MELLQNRVGAVTRDERGSVALVFSITLFALVGVLGLAIDFGTWTNKRTDLVGAADAGSLAGVRELANAILQHDDGNAVQRATTMAIRFANENGAGGATPHVSVSTGQQVSVVLTLQELGQQHFTKVISQDAPTIRVVSEATAVQAADACVVALSPTASPGVEYNLSGEVVAHGCSIWSNSDTDISTKGRGSGSVTADTNCAVGTSKIDGGLSLTPSAQSNCLAVKDPFADWSPPPTPWACKAENLVLDKPGDYTLQPGKYCGGITIKGGARVTFETGTYFIKGGALTVEGGGSVYGDEVAFLLTGGAAANLGGAAVVNLSAPKTGNMAGLVFAAGRDEPPLTSILRGNSEFTIEGHVYLPTHHLVYSGGPSGAYPADYTSIIASTIKFEGSSRIEFRNNEGSGPNYGARAFSHIFLSQ